MHTGIKVYRNVSTQNNLQFVLFSDQLNAQYPTTYTNIYAGYGLIPVLSDIDNDGDNDILAWSNALGGMVEYDKNLSVENGFGCDSMIFDYITGCWGNFSLNTFT